MKKCKVCRQEFSPRQPMAVVCSLDCAKSIGPSKRAKVAKIAAIKERKATKTKLLELKPRSYWLARAKRAIQRARRLEELAKGRGCMSCGRSQEEVMGTDAWKPGGAWDGGHFLSKGARPELALEPLNIWLQCKSCNAGSGKYARKGYTVNQSFRTNLIAAEGLELVDWLEGPHELNHYSIDELKAIEAHHTANANAWKAAA